ncbi:MAG: hypothetical protein ABJB97_10375 [Acidobacteriota bacterium]
MTRYADVPRGDVLEIEGETNHLADTRLINASRNGDEIHLFYRPRHHEPFTYLGQI